MPGEAKDPVTPPSVSPTNVVSVAIVEDHREFRDYLVALIVGTEGVSMHREFSLDGRGA